MEYFGPVLPTIRRPACQGRVVHLYNTYSVLHSSSQGQDQDSLGTLTRSFQLCAAHSRDSQDGLRILGPARGGLSPLAVTKTGTPLLEESQTARAQPSCPPGEPLAIEAERRNESLMERTATVVQLSPATARSDAVALLCQYISLPPCAGRRA